MRKLVLLMHASIDGFVAGPKGEMDWIHVDEEMFDIVGKLTDESDTALYGRVTYQLMENYWPTAAKKPNATKHDIQHSHWYNTVHKVIASKTMKDEHLENTLIISENLNTEILKLKQQPGKTILILGSPTVVHELMEDNLIDDYRLFINPIILGKGIPLFKGVYPRINLKLVESFNFSSGVIGLHYEKIPGQK